MSLLSYDPTLTEIGSVKPATIVSKVNFPSLKPRGFETISWLKDIRIEPSLHTLLTESITVCPTRPTPSREQYGNIEEEKAA